MLSNIGRFRLSALGRWQGVPIALGLIAIFIALRAFDPSPVQIMRLRVFDMFQQARPRDRPIAPVVIVNIDEKSLKEHGQWPWPRSIIGELYQ